MIGMRTRVLAGAALLSSAMAIAVLLSSTLAISIGGSLLGQENTRPAKSALTKGRKTAEPEPATPLPVAADPAPILVTTPTNPPIAKSVSSSRSTTSQSTWEYKIVREDIRNLTEAHFNALGKDHWEFCTTIPGNPGQILFKRQRGNSAVAVGAASSSGAGMMGPGAGMMGPVAGPGMGGPGMGGSSALPGAGPGAMAMGGPGMGGPGAMSTGIPGMPGGAPVEVQPTPAASGRGMGSGVALGGAANGGGKLGGGVGGPGAMAMGGPGMGGPGMPGMEDGAPAVVRPTPAASGRRMGSGAALGGAANGGGKLGGGLGDLGPGGAADGIPFINPESVQTKPELSKIAIVPLKHAQVDNLASIVVRVFDLDPLPGMPGMMGGPGMGSRPRERSKDPMRVAADSRTNSLIIIGPQSEIDRVKAFVEQLDVESTMPPGIRSNSN